YNQLYYELTHNERKEYHTKEYAKYFDVVETPKRGIKATPKEEVMKAELRNYGYFAMLSNDVRDPFEALSLYRSKDIVEKGFGNLKDRLNFRRMLVSSELALDGKLFVGFIALIYLSYLKKKMQKAKLFDRWTLQGVLDEIDLIEVFQAPESGKVIGEVTKKQQELFHSLGITPPS
ncbi:MAG: transposase, partial [Clostridiaceae bacterium]